MADLAQLENALRKADAAGNADDARALANAIRQQRQQPQKASFGNVQGGYGMEAVKPPVTIQGQQVDDIPAWEQFGMGVASAPASAIVGIGQMTGLMGDDRIRESTARIDAIRGKPAGFAGGVAGEIGMMAIPASKIAKLPRAGQYAASAVAGGTFAGLQPVREGESRSNNMMLGGALGVAGQTGSEVLSRAGQRAAKAITPEVRALYQAAKARGIELTPAQLSDSKALKWLQSSLSRLPLGTQRHYKNQKAEINRQIAKEIGEDAPVVTPEVYAAAKQRHSAQFEALTDRNNLAVSKPLIDKLQAIENEAKIAGGEVLSSVRAAISDFYERATTANGQITVPGASYQAFDSAMGQLTKMGTPVSHFVGKVQGVVRSAMDDSITPADREAWKTLRREYGNRKTIRDLVAKGDGGEISPSALMARVNANNAGKEAMATGRRGGLGELARIGQRIKEPPSSGTAERMAPYLLGAGAVANAPVTGAGLLAGRATQEFIDSPLLRLLMLRDGRGKTAQGLAPFLRNGGLAAAPTVGQAKRNDPRKRP